MEVVKRDGRKEPVMFDKITARIRKLCYGFDPKLVDPAVITMKVIQGVYDGVTTAALDDLAAETAAYMTTQHPDYSRLAARIAVSNRVSHAWYPPMRRTGAPESMSQSTNSSSPMPSS